MDDKNKDDKKSVGYIMGQAFFVTVCLCLMVLVVGITIKLLFMTF
jgi:hypothetical protein